MPDGLLEWMGTETWTMSSSVAYLETSVNDADDVDDEEVHTAWIGHTLHVLHVNVAAVLESPHYMGYMGSWSGNE